MIWLLGKRGFLFKSPIFLLIRKFVGPLWTLLSGNRVALIQSKFRGTRAASKSLADLRCTYPKNNWLPLEKILQVLLCLMRERHWPRPAVVDGWISSLEIHSCVPWCRWSSQAAAPLTGGVQSQHVGSMGCQERSGKRTSLWFHAVVNVYAHFKVKGRHRATCKEPGHAIVSILKGGKSDIY